MMMKFSAICSPCLMMALLAATPINSRGAGALTVQVGSPASPPTTLVSHFDTWRWHKGTNAPVAGWQTNTDASLDATWGSSPGGFGYADNANETDQCRTILSDMSGTSVTNYSTFYIRKTFQISNTVDSTMHIELTVDYDDAFVAYFDGAEVARSANAPGSAGTEPSYTALATSSHESSRGNSSPQPAISFDLGAVGGRTGSHVLALIGLNQNKSTSSDFILIADLALTGGAGGSTVSGDFLSIVYSNSVVFFGSNTVAGSTRVSVNGDDAVFDAGNGTWSKTNPLAPGVNQFFIAALDANGNLLASTNRLVVSEVASTSVGGTLAGDSVWSSAMGIIHVTNHVVVPQGGSLTIGDGAVVLLGSGVSIRATNASLIAAGTLQSPLYFLPADGTATWSGLISSGGSGQMTLNHIETVTGCVQTLNGATSLLEDNLFRDYPVSDPPIVYGNGAASVTLRRCHVARCYETHYISTLLTVEDCLNEYMSYTTSVNSDGIDLDSSPPGSVIRRTTIRRGPQSNIDAVDIGTGCLGTIVENCIFTDMSDKGVSIGEDSFGTVVRNCVMYRVGSGVAVKDGCTADLHGITVNASDYGFRLYEKTAGLGGGHVTNGYNNILWGNNTNVSLDNLSTIVLNYSDIGDTNWPGTGNISSDPLFLNAALRDYELQPGSPCIGAGQGGTDMGVTYPVGGIPSAPLAFAAISSDTNFVTLTWADDAENEDAFLVERAANGLNWQFLASVSANTSIYTDTTGTPGQKYYYRVQATNASGLSPYSNQASGVRQSPTVFVGGTIAADTTWLAGIHYVITNTVTVAANATLTIQPGATACFDNGVGMTVNGRLLAEGTNTARIVFTRAPGATTWGGITINGGAGSLETRIGYAHFEFNGTTAIHSSGGAAFLDHLTFGTLDHQYVSLDSSSFIVSNCEFPTPTAAIEPVHGTGGIKSGGRGIFLRNFFGTPNGYNDVVDFTGGNRPGQPIVQFINNVFSGASDDVLDLDGTDAWVEGNIFLHAHKNGSPDTSSGVSGGNDSGNTSELTIIGNIFYDCDQAATAKQGNFYTLINNTIVHQSHIGGLDTDGAVICLEDNGVAEAAGMYLEGNIIYDAEKLVRNLTNAVVTFTNNVMPFAWSGPGGGNSTNDPMLKHIPQLSDTYFTNWAQAQVMRDWFSLLTNSPTIGSGPNGRDEGAVVPLGASISGEPNGVTSQTNAALIVGVNRTGNGIPSAGWPDGSGYTHYKWRLDGGAWSAETPIATPIAITSLPSGAHYVEVIGKRDSGWYQDDPAFAADSVVTRSRTWIVTVDSDGDGLPDDWEQQYFGNLNEAAGDDPDGDGMTNLQEYLAGTDPHDAASRLWLQITPPENNSVVLQFTAVSNKSYTVQDRDSFSLVGWQKLQDITSAPSNRVAQLTNTLASPTRFYRIVTPKQP